MAPSISRATTGGSSSASVAETDAEARLQATFAALADPTRQRVVRLLARSPRCSSDIAEEVQVSRPTISRHLRVLREAGLVEPLPDETDFRMRWYRLRDQPLLEIRDWVAELEAFWGLQLDAFKTYAESGEEQP